MSERSQAQNDLMWSALTDLSRQVEWPVDGRMTFHRPAPRPANSFQPQAKA